MSEETEETKTVVTVTEDVKSLEVLEKELSNLKKENIIIKNALAEINLKALEDGLHLIERPFIPSELGFIESVLENAQDILIARVYTKEGYNIGRSVDTSIEHYTVLKPDGSKIELLMPNLRQAIIVLSAIGMNLSIKAYNNGDY